MELRILTEEDRGIVRRLFADVFEHEPWNDDWSDREQLDAYLSDLTGQKNSLTLGFFDGEKLAAVSMGCIKHWHAGTEYCIEEFCVDRGLQGRGIGSLFMEAVENCLAGKGIRRIFLQTDRGVPAYAFYRRRGFVELTEHVSFVKELGREGMKRRFDLNGIPAILWGEPSESVYMFVHGKMSRKEEAENFARIAAGKGIQTLSFDLAQHGERRDGAVLDVFSGKRDLKAVMGYVFPRWKHVSLYACSIGAYFSLQTCAEKPFEKALFQSPIVDMEYLVGCMMRWFSVTPEMLREKGVIDTPVDPLRWDYYQYILSHPVREWPIPTRILYGGRDNLQSMEVMRAFADRFGGRLTVSPDSEHPFMGEGDRKIADAWLTENI